MTESESKLNLSTLSPELLLNIFENVDDAPIRNGVNRRLLPFTRSLLYRKVNIESIETFKLFCRTLVENPSIGKEVLKMSAQIRSIYSIKESGIQFDDVVAMLKALTKLHTLNTNWCYLSSIIASKTVAQSSLPNLETLFLSNPFVHRRNCWNYVNFQYFNSYSTLQSLLLRNDLKHIENIPGYDYEIRELEIEGWRKDNYNLEENLARLEIQENQIDNVETSIASTTTVQRTNLSKSIITLNLGGNLKDPELIETISRFSSVTSLTIVLDIRYFTNINGIIQLFKQMSLNGTGSKILALNLNQHPYIPQFEVPSVNLYPSISVFTNLESLSLCSKLFNPQIFQYLRDPLPLKVLVFRTGTEVNITSLFYLLQPGPAKLSALRTLRLDNVEGKISEKRAFEVGPYFEEGDDEYEPLPHPDWILPLWEEGIFDEAGLIELIKLGEEVGVSVIGTSVDAIGIVEEYEQEEQDAIGAWEAARENMLEEHDAMMGDYYEGYEGDEFED